VNDKAVKRFPANFENYTTFDVSYVLKALEWVNNEILEEK